MADIIQQQAIFVHEIASRRSAPEWDIALRAPAGPASVARTSCASEKSTSLTCSLAPGCARSISFMNSTNRRHALLAIGKRHGVVKAADHRKMEIAFQRPFQNALPRRPRAAIRCRCAGRRRACARSVRRECDPAKRARQLACSHPGNGFERRAARIQRHAQNALAQIRREDLGDRRAADITDCRRLRSGRDR